MNSGWNFLSRRSNILLAGLVAVVLLLGAFAANQTSHLPDTLFFTIAVVGLTTCPLLALYFLSGQKPDQPLPLRVLTLSLLSLLMIALLLDGSDTNLVQDVLGIIHRRFRQPYWQWFGLVLAALIFLPLIWHALRQHLKSGQNTDLVVSSSFLIFLLLLYLPFGFHSIGHWEAWGYRAFLEGQTSWNIMHELVTRFWVAVPHLLATIIGPDSFVGFHWVHLAIFWGKLVLLYGILRKLQLAPLHSFLATMLFMVYPVNSALMSLRSLPNQFSIMSLLAAGYLALDYRDSPSRLRLLGIWLGLIFNVVTNETAYAIILVAPLLWHLGRRCAGWKNLNLTVIWYLFPLCKIAHLLLLSTLNLSFYNSHFFDGAGAAIGISSDLFGGFAQRMTEVYEQTFVVGWQDALAALGDSIWLSVSWIMLLLIAVVSVYLSRKRDLQRFPTRREASVALLSGLLFVMPAVGILIWLDQYSGDLWRMYFYVPIGASIAVFSMIILLSSPILNRRFRSAIVVAICLILILPGIVRLLDQHHDYVIRANNKASMLVELLQLLPQIKDDTIILLTTDMSLEQLEASDIYEFNYSNDLDNSILYILYGSRTPIHSIFCLSPAACSIFGGEETIFTSTSPEKLLQHTLVVKINEDLSVELLDQPAAYFGMDIDLAYDSEQLYNPNAMPPPRAYSMLAMAMQPQADA